MSIAKTNTMTIIDRGDVTYLFSYNELVAWFDRNGGIFVRTDKKWSNTTSKHIGRFKKEWAVRQEFTYPQSDIDKVKVELFGPIKVRIGA